MRLRPDARPIIDSDGGGAGPTGMIKYTVRAVTVVRVTHTQSWVSHRRRRRRFRVSGSESLRRPTVTVASGSA